MAKPATTKQPEAPRRVAAPAGCFFSAGQQVGEELFWQRVAEATGKGGE